MMRAPFPPAGRMPMQAPQPGGPPAMPQTAQGGSQVPMGGPPATFPGQANGGAFPGQGAPVAGGFPGGAGAAPQMGGMLPHPNPMGGVMPQNMPPHIQQQVMQRLQQVQGPGGGIPGGALSRLPPHILSMLQSRRG